MTKQHRIALAGRPNWQKINAKVKDGTEDAVGAVVGAWAMMNGFEFSYQKVIKNFYPAAFPNIEASRTKRRGLKPDCYLVNPENDKGFVLECKRQKDGGTAHERMCMYLTQGFVKRLRVVLNQPPDVYPFTIVADNGLATLPEFQNLFDVWFDGLPNHTLFKVQRMKDILKTLMPHLDNVVLPLLK